MSAPQLLQFFDKLQQPIPQYVLGTLPAIATIASTPESGLITKLIWLARCLGCPFTGLFYFCIISSDPIAMSTYWLPSKYFIRDITLDNIQDNRNLCRPVGHHAKRMQAGPKEKEILKSWNAEASVLDRLSSLVSIYYMSLGIMAGIYRAAIGPCMYTSTYVEWPYISFALSWTLPAICIRILKGNVVDKVQTKDLEESRIIVSDLPYSRIKAERIRTAIVALASIIIPWSTVILAYNTRPIGFFCRSKFLSTISSIWSFNNILAYVSHVNGEKEVSGHWLIHAWFCFCGYLIALLLILLSILANHRSWWIDLFGSSCLVPPCVSDT
jgi:hypothetical protein